MFAFARHCVEEGRNHGTLPPPPCGNTANTGRPGTGVREGRAPPPPTIALRQESCIWHRRKKEELKLKTGAPASPEGHEGERSQTGKTTEQWSPRWCASNPPLGFPAFPVLVQGIGSRLVRPRQFAMKSCHFGPPVLGSAVPPHSPKRDPPPPVVGEKQFASHRHFTPPIHCASLGGCRMHPSYGL